MDELESRFAKAKEEYFESVAKDFDSYTVDKLTEINDAVEKINIRKAFNSAVDKTKTAAQSTLVSSQEEIKSLKEDNVFAHLDKNKDGKLNLDGLKHAAKALGKSVASTASKAAESVEGIDAGEVLSGAKETIGNAGKSVVEVDYAGLASTATKIGKTAVGVQGLQNRKTAAEIRNICGNYYELASEITEDRREKLNYAINEFGEYRVRSLHATLGRFLHFLEILNQKNAVKEYEILMGADIDTEQLAEIKKLDMDVSEALRTTAIAGTFAAATVAGTPTAVTAVVSSIGAASTGTMISTLHGAAASNAILAWLGGGAIANGGGGMAVGAMVLGGITISATAVSLLISAGTLVSLHYGKKLTEAKEYEKEVGIAVAKLEKAWLVMDAISTRVTELRDVTEELRWRLNAQLDELELIVPQFDSKNEDHITLFTKCGRLVKTMVELAQTPLLDDEGNLSTESMTISSKVRKVLNTEV